MIPNTEIVFRLPKKEKEQEEFKKFSDFLRKNISQFVDRMPQDGFITVTVNMSEKGYKIALRLTSTVMNFFISSVGKSPFFAFEKVLQSADEQVRIWKINRQL